MPEIFSASKKKKDLPLQEKYPLSSFLMWPNGVNFETRESEEKIILFLRKHLVTNIPWIITTIIMLLTPIFILNTTVLDSTPSNFRFIFILIWYLITTAYFLESFLTWFFNVYIVTDERIIDIDFYNLIYKEVSDANIDKIQDVTYKMGGVVRTLFNYGDVLIQTASEVPNFDFLAVPHPDKIVKVLQDLRIEEQQEAIEGRIR
ncbi:MAG: PH domain-containing protein [Patescibacteria group bacterium]